MRDDEGVIPGFGVYYTFRDAGPELGMYPKSEVQDDGARAQQLAFINFRHMVYTKLPRPQAQT
jgi:hypothetical protein